MSTPQEAPATTRIPLSDIRPLDKIIGLGGFAYTVMWVGELVHPSGTYPTPFIVNCFAWVGPLGPCAWDTTFTVLRHQPGADRA